MAQQPEVQRFKITLKTDWDIPVNLPTPSEKKRGHFAGRHGELKSLTNEILRRENGAILISGHRGAGKTSLVHRALNIARERNGKILPILVNSGNIQTFGVNGTAIIDPKALIEGIVRRLFATAQNVADFPKDLLAPISSLYRKCVAADFKLVESVALDAHRAHEQVNEQSAEHQLNINQIISIITNVAFLIAGAVAFSPLISSLILRVSLAIGIGAGAYKGSAILRRSVKSTTASQSKVSAEELYQFDNKLGNLEFDLEIIHRMTREKDWKLVYVIDELDKLPLEHITAVIEGCKNLFTLSDAIFIFIGHEKLFGLGDTQKQGVYTREKEYTYFNSRYYIGPPTTTDLEDFLADIIVSTEATNEDDVTAIKHFLFFEARNDFFDLINAIRGRITYFEDNLQPVITISADGLDAAETMKSRLSICIASLYEDKYRSPSASRWQQNAEMLGELYAAALALVSTPSPTEVAVPAGPHPKDALIRDFYTLLTKLGALGPVTKKQHNQQYGNQNITSTIHPVLGGIQTLPPRRLNMLAEFERNYLADNVKYAEHVVAVANIWQRRTGQQLFTAEQFLTNPEAVCKLLTSWGYDPRNSMQKHFDLYNKFTSQPPPHSERQTEIDELTQNVRTCLEGLHNAVPNCLGAILTKLAAANELILKAANYQHHIAVFGEGAKFLRTVSNTVQPLVVFSEDLKKQVAIFRGAAAQLNLHKSEISGSKSVVKILCTVLKDGESLPTGVIGVQCWDAKVLDTSATKAIEKVMEYLIA